jgi:N-acetyl-1-D-myo-inositol-2-amino-2-deoxy-alpha-D-glucopyranoside deacetylase
MILPWSEYRLRGKLAGSAIALAAGIVVGAVATVSHQSSVLLFGVGIPVGIIVALLAVTALLVGLRVLFDTRIVAGSAAVGILGVIALLSLESQGGSILIPATPVAYYWIYGPVLVAALVLAWPRIVRPTRDKIEVTPEPKGPPAP